MQLGKQQQMTQISAPVTHVGHTDGTANSWLCPGTAQDCCSHLECELVDGSALYLCLSLVLSSLCLSKKNPKTKKIFKIKTVTGLYLPGREAGGLVNPEEQQLAQGKHCFNYGAHRCLFSWNH